MRKVRSLLSGSGVICCLIFSPFNVLAQLQASSGTISFPSDIMSIKLGISTSKLLKLRPRTHPMTVPGTSENVFDTGATNQILTEELPADPRVTVTYGFRDGRLSNIGVGWIDFKKAPLEVRNTLLEGADKLWGSKRQLGVYEYLQEDGTKQQYVEFRWALRKERAVLTFSSLGVSIAKGDARTIKRTPARTRLSGEAERKVLADFSLTPS